MGPDKYQQLPHKASILQLNDETTGNTENRADYSSLFEIFVHHLLSHAFKIFFFHRETNRNDLLLSLLFFSFLILYTVFVHSVLITFTRLHVGRRMSVQKMLRKRIPLHPSWNYIIFTRMDR